MHSGIGRKKSRFERSEMAVAASGGHLRMNMEMTVRMAKFVNLGLRKCHTGRMEGE